MIPLAQWDNYSTYQWVYHGLLHIPKVRQGTVLMEFGKFCSTKVAINSLPALRTASGETLRRTQYSWRQHRCGRCGCCGKTHPIGPTQTSFIINQDHLTTSDLFCGFPQRMETPFRSWNLHGPPGKLLTTACRTSSPSARASGASLHPGG